MSSAPKSFAPATPFGASPQSPIATETKPLALNSGTQTPAMSGYNMQPMTPATPETTSLGGGGAMQDLLAQLRARRSGGSAGPMPFYG